MRIIEKLDLQLVSKNIPADRSRADPTAGLSCARSKKHKNKNSVKSVDFGGYI